MLGYNQAEIEVELESVVTSAIERCIKFRFGGSGGTVEPYEKSVVMSFTNGLGVANMNEIPAGVVWTCINAKDEKHTLRRNLALDTEGGKYVASFTDDDKLIGGDLTNDNKIDILDFGAFVGQWGWSLGAPNCEWSGRHGDISGNGTVGVEDFSFIQIHFLTLGELLCGKAASVSSVGADDPRTSVSVRDLAKVIGVRDAMNADLNRDGMVDMTDVRLFVRKFLTRR